MSGQRINSKQIQIYLKAREIGCTQETSAAKGGFSVRTGRRIETGEHQPQKGKARDWRTREDPLESVWESELKPLLISQPQLRPMTLWEYLQEKYPGQYGRSILRTLQRRVRQWKATSGPPKEVMFTQEHQPGELGLCQHYQMCPTRNNRGKSHENGSIESPHGHFKRRLHQALLLRNSCDFDSIESYQQLIAKTVQRLNISSESKWQQEKVFLQPLPAHKFPDYEVLSVRVTCHSTITVRCILYTVPSQLIGHRLTLHLDHDHLDVFVGNQLVIELPRIYVSEDSYKRRARCVDYRHVVDSLRIKPRAFLQCRWQQDLLPDGNYRRIWLLLRQQFVPEQACRLMVESLYIAAKQDKETAVAQWLMIELQQQTLTLSRLQRHFCPPPLSPRKELLFSQHSLSNYDQLLTHDSFSCPSNVRITPTAKIPATVSYESTVVNHRSTSSTTGLVLRTVPDDSL